MPKQGLRGVRRVVRKAQRALTVGRFSGFEGRANAALTRALSGKRGRTARFSRVQAGVIKARESRTKRRRVIAIGASIGGAGVAAGIAQHKERKKRKAAVGRALQVGYAMGKGQPITLHSKKTGKAITIRPRQQ